jgi:hypothetical protein
VIANTLIMVYLQKKPSKTVIYKISIKQWYARTPQEIKVGIRKPPHFAIESPGE